MNKCKDCKNRKIQCHGTCEHYIEWCKKGKVESVKIGNLRKVRKAEFERLKRGED